MRLSLRVVTRGASAGETRVFTVGPIVLGRGVDCSLPIHDPAVSRSHCELRVEGGRWLIVDLGSRNGTRVNRRRLTEPRPVAAGDTIELGTTRVVVEAADTGCAGENEA